ncbi:MAG: hypothetical protein KDC98_13510 [Planctomycetes bacterium]|nr:hypothetical protein [Planctomycetota bacterium]
MHKHSHLLPLAIATSLALPAQTWTESGDAGDLPNTVQPVLGSGPLTHISGNLGTGADGNFQVSVNQGNHAAVIEAWGHVNGKFVCRVDVFDAAGNPADRGFTCHYRRGGQPTDIAGYLWADQPASAQYTPNTFYSWNGNRPDPTITRYTNGLYRCLFPGIANPFQGGSFEVSAYKSAPTLMLRAKIDSWGVVTGTTDLEIFVRTFDGAGNQVDASFLLNYHLAPGQIAASDGSGSYVWANQPTAALYAPPNGYRRSNGTYGPNNSATIGRLGTGWYRVDLPDGATDYSAATCVARGTSSDYAAISYTSPNGPGTVVYVYTFDAAGAPVDSEFLLNYTTNHPAGTLATNTVIGHGCSDTLLAPLSRPITGTNWTYQVTDAPAGASLGFILLGLGNPNLDLTPLGMTGCARYTDQLAIALMPGTYPGATGSTAISPAASFLGLNLFAQVALLVPGANALGVTASNGLRGRIGDV